MEYNSERSSPMFMRAKVYNDENSSVGASSVGSINNQQVRDVQEYIAEEN
jgi:hypothetical protein